MRKSLSEASLSELDELELVRVSDLQEIYNYLIGVYDEICETNIKPLQIKEEVKEELIKELHNSIIQYYSLIKEDSRFLFLKDGGFQGGLRNILQVFNEKLVKIKKKAMIEHQNLQSQVHERLQGVGMIGYTLPEYFKVKIHPVKHENEEESFICSSPEQFNDFFNLKWKDALVKFPEANLSVGIYIENEIISLEKIIGFIDANLGIENVKNNKWRNLAKQYIEFLPKKLQGFQEPKNETYIISPSKIEALKLEFDTYWPKNEDPLPEQDWKKRFLINEEELQTIIKGEPGRQKSNTTESLPNARKFIMVMLDEIRKNCENLSDKISQISEKKFGIQFKKKKREFLIGEKNEPEFISKMRESIISILLDPQK